MWRGWRYKNKLSIHVQQKKKNTLLGPASIAKENLFIWQQDESADHGSELWNLTPKQIRDLKSRLRPFCLVLRRSMLASTGCSVRRSSQQANLPMNGIWCDEFRLGAHKTFIALGSSTLARRDQKMDYDTVFALYVWGFLLALLGCVSGTKLLRTKIHFFCAFQCFSPVKQL